MGLIKKFSVATGVLLTLGGGGMAGGVYHNLDQAPETKTALECREALKTQGGDCTAEAKTALLSTYEKGAGMMGFAAAGFAGTTLLALTFALRRREPKTTVFGRK